MGFEFNRPFIFLFFYGQHNNDLTNKSKKN